MQVAGDVTQAVVALAVTAMFVALAAGFVAPSTKVKWMSGSAAKIAAARGGTKASPMQA
jgi:hypothetical protein